MLYYSTTYDNAFNVNNDMSPLPMIYTKTVQQCTCT